MNETLLKMAAAGVAFGCWPLLMNRSALTGTTASLVLTSGMLVFVSALVLKQGVVVSGANWWFAIAASCMAGIGLVAFNSGLADATPKSVSTLFIIMIVVQTAVPAVYHAVMNGGVSLRQGLGFAAAFVAAGLLSWKE